MDTEHSILLKYFVKGHRLNSKTEMADTPIIKIEKEYQNPPNVESEVPGTHEIRETSKNNNENNSPEEYNEITVTSAGFTLSPVITVTKNESTFTKGNMKQHKVTVTEDISLAVDNGIYQIADNIDDLSSGDQADSIDSRSNTTADNMEGEEKIPEERKSKIPMSRLKQVAERVKRERQAQREKAKPRRSSIPKLKDPKKVKRDTSLNIEPQVDDEFEKLYEEIVEDKPVEIEVKLPVVSIDDPEKIETKFEELIHAYDEEETVDEEKLVEELEGPEKVVDELVGEDKVVDELVRDEKVVDELVRDAKVIDELVGEEKVVEELVGEEKIVEQAVEEVRPSISKVSKIPALSKKEDSPSMRALMERVKEVSAAEAELKDGGFKVTASSIRTKRYSRGNSELSRDEQRIDSIEEIEDDTVFDTDNAQSTDKDGDVSKGDKKATKPRSIRKKSELLEQQRQAKLREDLRRKQKQLRNGVEEPIVVDKVGDNIDDLNAVLMKTERIVRNISREINEDKKSIINTETVTTEEQNDGGVRTITTTTTETFVVDSPVVHEKIIRNISKDSTGTNEVITEEKPKKAASSIPVKTERFTRGISREMGNFRQSIHREVSQSKEDLNATDNKVDNKPVVKKETMRVEQIEKEGIKIGIPVFTKISRSYSKGKIQNVEMTRTIEWKPADVVTNKALNRSTSEAITKNELKDAKRDFKAPVSETNNNNINGDTTRDRVIENNIKDTVKAQAKTKSIRKVTEFKTEEQVTNEERTTFTLSRSVDLSLDNEFKTARAIGTQMSVDGQNIDRDFKIGKDASTRISVINEKLDPKDLKPSREIGTQMSVDMSKTHEENNKVPLVLKKKETADSTLPVREKDSDITQVTTLKGNVSRLKEKMGKDKEIGSKKEKEEEFPKKKSVLSKIAMFERLERDPIEQLPLRKLKCKYKPPTTTTYQTEDTEEITNTVATEPKEETQIEPNTKEDKVQISVTYDTVAYTNEPIIVKEYLKSEYDENLLKDNEISKEVTIVNTVDTTNVDDSEYTEPVSPLPEIVDLNPKESVIEIPKTPEPRKDTEMPTIFPPRRDYEADIGRTRPGKLNLNNWTSQVEINKSTVDKVAVFKEEQIQEIVHTLPSIDIKAYASQVSVSQELSRNFDDKTSEDNEKSAKVLYGKVKIQLETAQTIPEVIDVTPVSNIVISDDYQNVDDGNLPLDEKETQSYDLVPDTTPGCPVLTELDFETLKLMNKSPETREILVETRPKPGKLDLSLWKNRVEENRNHIGKDIKNNPEMKKEVSTKVFKPRRISDTVPLKNELNDAGNKIEISVVKDNETNDSTYKYAITDSDVTSDEIYTSSSESDEESYKGKDRHRMPTGVSMYKKDVKQSKPKPGKLDLSMWKNQVEANRNLADFKKKPKKTEITTEAPAKKVFKSYTKGTSDTVQGKDNFNNAENKDESPQTGTDHKSELQVEIETVLPETVEAKSIESKPETAKPLIALINVNKHETTYVPNENTNTEEHPKLLQGKIDLETGYTYECKAQIGVHDPDTVCFTSADYVEENVTTLPAIITFKTDDIKVENPKPGKLDLKAWEDQVEANKVLVDKIEAVRNEHLEDVAKTLTGKVDFVTFEHVGEARMFQATVDLNTHDDKVEIAEAEDDLDADIDVEYESIKPDSNIAPLNYIFPRRASRDDQLYNEGNRAQILNQLVSESLSDPDLVKDEPVRKPNSDKDSVIGSVKRKLYFLSSINRVHNPIIREESREKDDVGNDDNTKADAFETKAYLINDLGPKSNAASIEDIEAHTSTVTEDNKPTTPPNTAQIETADVKGRSNENVFHFDVTRVENRMTRSVYEVGEFKNSTEDMQRAKSLAELDLGDAVQGKVRSILSRINSVDFGRRESIKTSISVKEMPRKMSVLEKIALFEGKLTSPKPEPPTEDTPTDNQEPVAIPGLSEEAYLKKIQELQSAKVQFGKMDKMNSVVLSDGTKMPVLTVGTALLDARLLKHIIGAAIDMGYRAIDTAYIYGNEKEVGEAIQAKIDDGTVTREQLYIMGKLWSTFHKTDLVETACKNSLEALGITYFDLYMIHNPMSFKEGPDPIPKIASVIQFSEYDYLDAWYGMESLVNKGLAKSIGVSNFNSVQLQRILDKGKIAPVVNQVECHPYLSQQRLDAFCKEKDIQLSCYGVLGSKGTPAEYKNSTFAVIDDPLVKVMASGLGVSPAQLLIRYQIDSGHNVVVKASCAPHLWDNLQALTFELDKPQVEALHALNKNKRTFTFKGMGETHKNYPFLEPF